MSTKENNITTMHVPYAHPNFECDIIPSIAYHNITNLPLFHDGGLLELNYAPFFCTYVKRDVYNKTEGLIFEFENENQISRTFSDFIQYMLKLKIYQTPDAFVYYEPLDVTNKSKETKNKLWGIINKNKTNTNFPDENGKPLWDI